MSFANFVDKFTFFLTCSLIKIKWMRYNKSVHRNNLKNNRCIHPSNCNSTSLESLKNFLHNTYLGLVKVNGNLFYFSPAAALNINESVEEYLKLIGPKSRNMIKKAERNGFFCEIIEWNDFLDDIYEINTSTQFRQGRQMDAAYLSYPQRIDYTENMPYAIKTVGVFKGNKLVAYCNLHFYGQIATVNRILGNKSHLTYGIMNILIYKVFLLCREFKASYVIYISMQNCKKNPLSAFKRRVGFEEYSIFEQ